MQIRLWKWSTTTAHHPWKPNRRIIGWSRQGFFHYILLFLNWQKKQFYSFLMTVKKAHQQYWNLKNDSWISNLEPICYLYIYHLHESVYSSTVTALMKVINGLLFWPGLCISPCFLGLQCSLWCISSRHSNIIGISHLILSWFW